MQRTEKEALVASVRESIETASIVVVTRQVGLTVSEVTDLRSQMREAGAQIKVIKNTLAKLAITDSPYDGLKDYLTGPTALAFSEDPVAAAKVATKFADDNDKFEVVGGSLGDKLLDINGIQALAKLPSLDALRGKIIGVLSAPATKVARVLNAPAEQVARVCGAYGAKQD